jgi:ABC-type transport system involved in multi-copper enzyme maturation permease subunit
LIIKNPSKRHLKPINLFYSVFYKVYRFLTNQSKYISMCIFFIGISLICLLITTAVCYLVSFFNTEAEEPIDINLEDDEANG